MNKKGDIEISLKTLIGFVLVAIILFAFVGLFMKMWGMFVNQPNEATLNSFDNLVYEINNLKDGEEKEVPYYIQEGLYLRTSCEIHIYENKQGQVLNDICICKGDHPCEKRLKRQIISYLTDETQIISILNDPEYGQIGFEKEKEVRNLKIIRDINGVKITLP